MDFLHHFTEPGVERRIGCCELSNRRFVRRFHVDQGEGAVRRLLMPGSMTADARVAESLKSPGPEAIYLRLWELP